MKKTTLEHILNIELNRDDNYGRATGLMIWSPVDHCWLDGVDSKRINPRYWKKFLLKQEVMRMSLRNDSPNCIAIFLKDYGKEKNRRIREKYKR